MNFEIVNLNHPHSSNLHTFDVTVCMLADSFAFRTPSFLLGHEEVQRLLLYHIFSLALPTLKEAFRAEGSTLIIFSPKCYLLLVKNYG